jgi:peptidoglycan/LPS O-acetylase OafA/YrhL
VGRRSFAAGSQPLDLINLIKVVASQFILWHHFALYGPMSDKVHPAFERGADWLKYHGVLAVQAFLVIGGFLAAQSLARRKVPLGFAELPRHMFQRYLRLVEPLVLALIMAVAASALARALIEHPTISAAPTFGQALAHLLLVQDITGHEALSAGVWYVAIDFQLFCVFSLIAVVGKRYALGLCAGLTLLSLFWFNRSVALDAWALYFFGAYGLGVLANFIAHAKRRGWWLTVMTVVVMAALMLDWRSRILVAGLIGMFLAATGGRSNWQFARHWVVERLAEISYSLFLVHYPVLLTVGAVVHYYWPDQIGANMAGLLTAWALSLWLAYGVTQLTAGSPGEWLGANWPFRGRRSATRPR